MAQQPSIATRNRVRRIGKRRHELVERFFAGTRVSGTSRPIAPRPLQAPVSVTWNAGSSIIEGTVRMMSSRMLLKCVVAIKRRMIARLTRVAVVQSRRGGATNWPASQASNVFAIKMMSSVIRFSVGAGLVAWAVVLPHSFRKGGAGISV